MITLIDQKMDMVSRETIRVYLTPYFSLPFPQMIEIEQVVLVNDKDRLLIMSPLYHMMRTVC